LWEPWFVLATGEELEQNLAMCSSLSFNRLPLASVPVGLTL
jgi:hypothetical protein